MNRLLMFVFSRKAVKSEAYEASEIHAVRPFFCFLFVFFPLGCVQRELKIYAEVNLVTALVGFRQFPSVYFHATISSSTLGHFFGTRLYSK